MVSVMLLFLSNVYYRIMFVFIVCYYMFTILDYSSALEYSIIRRYTNIVYYYYTNIVYYILLLCVFLCLSCVLCV